MNFTREPIIETVITPKDGCKLVLRSSKGGEEEYVVEAVEVVSFGRSFFFRSVESTKAFLLPITDYEILESRETRLALKTSHTDRQIKIGGGREAQLRPQPRSPEGEQPVSAESPSHHPQDRKGVRDRRRRSRRGRDRGPDMHPPQQGYPDRAPPEPPIEPSSPEALANQPEAFAEESPKPSFISRLFPPPPTLIKETLSRYKPSPEENDRFSEREDDEEKGNLEEDMFDHPISNEKDEDSH